MSFCCLLGEFPHAVGARHSVIKCLCSHSLLLLKLIYSPIRYDQVMSSRVLSLFHCSRHLYSLLQLVMPRPPIVWLSRFVLRLTDRCDPFPSLILHQRCSFSDLDHLHLHFWLMATRGLMGEKFAFRHRLAAVPALPADIVHFTNSGGLRLVIHSKL